MADARKRKGVLRKLPEVVLKYKAAEDKRRREANIVDDRPKFVMIEVDVCDDPNLPGEAKFLYMMLLRCCHFGEREIPISRKELADYVGWSLPTLDGYLTMLKEAGYITAVVQYDNNGNQRENLWVINGPYESYEKRETERLLKVLEDNGVDGLLAELERTPHIKNLVGGVLNNLGGGSPKNLGGSLPNNLGTNILKESLKDPLEEEDVSTAQSAADVALNEIGIGLEEITATKEVQASPADTYLEGYRLAKHLAKRILENKPDYKMLPETDEQWHRWASEIDKMIRLDGRFPARVEQVIDWCHLESDFWFKNILSPSSLRGKFDRLEMDMASFVRPGASPEGSRKHGRVKASEAYPPEARDLLRVIKDWEGALGIGLPETREREIKQELLRLREALRTGDYDYRPAG